MSALNHLLGWKVMHLWAIYKGNRITERLRYIQFVRGEDNTLIRLMRQICQQMA